jgi:hypothetical protein
MPGGSQPPFEHVPPPSAANGSGVLQPPVGAGAPDPVDGAKPGGNHCPFEQMPPPSDANGSTPVHPEEEPPPPIVVERSADGVLRSPAEL